MAFAPESRLATLMTMTSTELKSALEAIIYAADEPATLEQLASVLGHEKHIVRAALDELVASYATDERGVEIRAVAGGYRVYTKPQHHDLVRRFIKSLRPPLRLTMPALETLAVIAYKQPVTQPEIQEIRGVNCAGVIETLLEKRLITTAGGQLARVPNAHRCCARWVGSGPRRVHSTFRRRSKVPRLQALSFWAQWPQAWLSNRSRSARPRSGNPSASSGPTRRDSWSSRKV